MRLVDNYFFAKVVKKTGRLFYVYKIKAENSFWVDFDLAESHFGTSFDIKNFYYITDEHSEIMNIEVDGNDRKIALAEFYGGEGLGGNLGGARVGSYSGLQVKGLGYNGLAGADAPYKHSNGSLTLLDAISEVVYSKLINLIIPHCAIHTYGIINTGDYTSYCEFSGRPADGRTAGALLVREACLRPAHFLRNHSALTYRNHREALKDFRRIDSAIKSFASEVGSNKLVEVVSECVRATSYKFGYARAIRLAHGSMSPSNVTLAGRWLDLSSSNFISDCSNYASSEIQIPFLDEPQAGLSYLIEFAYNLNKATNVNINPLNLTKLYWDSFKRGLTHGVSWCLGIDDVNKAIFEDELPLVTDRTNDFICRYKKVNSLDNVSFKKYVESIVVPFFITAFKNIMTSSSKLNIDSASYEVAIISSLVDSLKRNVFLSVYSKSNFSKFLMQDIVKCEEVIGESVSFIEFIKCRCSGNELPIFRFGGLSITFLVESRQYLVVRDGVEEYLLMNGTRNSELLSAFDVFGCNVMERIDFIFEILNKIFIYYDSM